MFKVNRLEVINHTKNGTGRQLVIWEQTEFEVEVQLQDDDRTLKIFLSDKEE